MCSTGTCGNPVQYSQPVQYRPPQAVQYTQPIVNRPAVQYQVPNCKTNSFQVTQPAQYAASPPCVTTTYTQSQTTPTPTGNRLGSTSGTTALVQKDTGCCQVLDTRGNNIAGQIPTQFFLNKLVPFETYETFDPNSKQDIIMQSSRVISGAYFPDITKIGNVPAGLVVTGGRHKFMKVSALTMLFGNLTFTNTTPAIAGTGVAYTTFTVHIPVPGSLPLSLAGTVSGTLIDPANGNPSGVAAIAADVPLDQSTYSNHIGLTISFPVGALGPGSRLDVGFSFSYMSVQK